MNSWKKTAILALAASGLLAEGQQAPGFFKPLTDGDGIRYPLVLSPAVYQVLGPISMVPATDGLFHLAYVIRLNNQSTSAMTLQSVEPVDPYDNNKPSGTNRTLSIKGEDVTGEVLPFLAPPTLDKANYSRTLPAGTSGAIYMDVTYRSKSDIPAYLSHRITVTQQTGGATQTYTTVDLPNPVDTRDPVILAPPLHGPRWLDANGCCLEVGPHRWVLSPINGAIAAAEMFAIDFVQLRPDLTGYKGSIDQTASYDYYGADVYNAAAGTVVEVVRDLPNSTPGRNPTDVTTGTVAGNHVIVDIGGGRYVMYAHLAPFSATVSVGSFIQQGYVLGKLGNSGNTDAPHLHFQVMDRPSSLGAHGLPFVIDHMTRDQVFAGSLDDASNLFSAGVALPVLPATKTGQFSNVMPLSLDLANFQ